MIVPGLANAATVEGNFATIHSDTTKQSVTLLFGAPTSAVDVFLTVAHGVVCGSDNSFWPGLWVDLPSGSVVRLTNLGRITGKGGDGGNGHRGEDFFETGSTSPSLARGGGGGGGAGTTSGYGGGADESSSATNGVAGTATLGGAAGANGIDADSYFLLATPGRNAGDAIILNAGVELIITNVDGEIWAPGGGGTPGNFGTNIIPYSPGAGGDIAMPGGNGNRLTGSGYTGAPGPLTPGTAGYAVRGAVADITFISGGSSPELKGTVGP